MKMRLLTAFCGLLLFAGTAAAVDYRVEPLDEGPPSEVSPEIAKLLNPKGLKVIRGTSRTLCEIWLCKQWQNKPDFKATPDVNYPFLPGELIGVAKYVNKGADFRDQDIEPGVYTMRYAQQPVDGAHIGTSPTRDFLLLVSAAKDKTHKVMDYKPLVQASAEAAGSTHPMLLSMQRVEGDAAPPAIRNNEERDWWIVQFAGSGKAGDKTSDVKVDLVVVGQAE